MRLTNEQFRMIRKVHQLSATEFGELLGYSQTYISAIERGEMVVTDNVVNRIEKALGIDALKMKEIEVIYEKFTVK